MGLFSNKKSKQEKLEEAKKKRNIYESRKSAGEMNPTQTQSRVSFAGGEVTTTSRGGNFAQKKGGKEVSAQKNQSKGDRVSALNRGSRSVPGSSHNKRGEAGFGRSKSSEKKGFAQRGNKTIGSGSASKKSSSGLHKPLGF